MRLKKLQDLILRSKNVNRYFWPLTDTQLKKKFATQLARPLGDFLTDLKASESLKSLVFAQLWNEGIRAREF